MDHEPCEYVATALKQYINIYGPIGSLKEENHWRQVYMAIKKKLTIQGTEDQGRLNLIHELQRLLYKEARSPITAPRILKVCEQLVDNVRDMQHFSMLCYHRHSRNGLVPEKFGAPLPVMYMIFTCHELDCICDPYDITDISVGEVKQKKWRIPPGGSCRIDDDIFKAGYRLEVEEVDSDAQYCYRSYRDDKWVPMIEAVQKKKITADGMKVPLQGRGMDDKKQINNEICNADGGGASSEVVVGVCMICGYAK